MQVLIRYSAAAVISIGLSQAAYAESDAELAKELSNPIASLTSVPFEYQYDDGIGPSGDGERQTLLIKPVIPFSLNDEWNIISRTIIPYIELDDVTPGSSDSGTGDIVQSFFFSPKKPNARGAVWGIGPIVQIPTSSSNGLGYNEWGAGITGVILRQAGPWTFGGLASHVWDVGGTDVDQSDTFLQPFLAYNTKNLWTISANTESTYDWEDEEWSVPLNFKVSKLVTIGKQRVSLSGTLRYWAESSDAGPEDLGFTLGATFLFPK